LIQRRKTWSQAERKITLDKIILDKIILDKIILDKIILDKIILDKIILDKIILDKIILDSKIWPCCEDCTLCLGVFPGVWIFCADVSKHLSVQSSQAV